MPSAQCKPDRSRSSVRSKCRLPQPSFAIVRPNCIMKSFCRFTPQLLRGLRGLGSRWSRTATGISSVQALQSLLDFDCVAAPKSPDGFFVRQGSADRIAQLRFVTENLSNVFRAEDTSRVAVGDHAEHFL